MISTVDSAYIFLQTCAHNDVMHLSINVMLHLLQLEGGGDKGGDLTTFHTVLRSNSTWYASTGIQILW